MAESVDALVSNTSGAIRAGSTPALGTEQSGVSERMLHSAFSAFFLKVKKISFFRENICIIHFFFCTFVANLCACMHTCYAHACLKD